MHANESGSEQVIQPVIEPAAKIIRGLRCTRASTCDRALLTYLPTYHRSRLYECVGMSELGINIYLQLKFQSCLFYQFTVLPRLKFVYVGKVGRCSGLEYVLLWQVFMQVPVIVADLSQPQVKWLGAQSCTRYHVGGQIGEILHYTSCSVGVILFNSFYLFRGYK